MTTGLPQPFQLDDIETMEAGMDLLIRNGMLPVYVGIDANGSRFISVYDANEGDIWVMTTVQPEAQRASDSLAFPVVCI